jgi:hypothetical protein
LNNAAGSETSIERRANNRSRSAFAATLGSALQLHSENEIMRRFFVTRIATVLILGGSILAARFDVLGQQPAKGAGESRKNREKIGELFGKPVYRDEIPRNGDLEEELHQLFFLPLSERYGDAHRAELEPTAAEIAAVVAYLKKRPSNEEATERELKRQLKEVETQLASANLTERKRDRLESQKQLIEMRVRQLPTREPQSTNSFLLTFLCSAASGDKHAVEMSLRDPKLSPQRRAELEERKRACEAMESPERFAAPFVLVSWKFERHLYDKFGGGRVLWQQSGLEAFDATRHWLESEERVGNFQITDPKLRTEFYRYWTRRHDFMLESQAEIREQFLEPEWARKGGLGRGTRDGG